MLYSGPLFTGSPWDYHVSPLFLSGTVSGLAAGRHTLSLRVTRQENSPARYRVSAHIQVGTQQIAIWDESATLATGAPGLESSRWATPQVRGTTEPEELLASAAERWSRGPGTKPEDDGMADGDIARLDTV